MSSPFRTPIRSLLALAFALSGCVDDLDTTRVAEARGSFGETVYREACQRVAYTAQLDERDAGLRQTVDVTGTAYGAVCSQDAPAPADAPQRLKALQAQRAALVAAVDRILPRALLDPMESFLESITPLSDDGTMEDSIGKMGLMLAALRDDGQLTAAFARLSGRTGYRPLKASDLVRSVVAYPAFDDLMQQTLSVLMDGTDQPVPELTALLSALSAELRATNALPAPGDPQRSLKIALDLLFSTSPDFAEGTPRPLALRDVRGVAQVARDGNGNLPAPFVDNDGDGLPDVDASGRYLGGDGKPLAIDSPFPRAGVKDLGARDALGRALDGGGQPRFRYLDLDPTFAAALTRELKPLVDPSKDSLLGLAWGASSLMGPRSMVMKSYQDPRTGKPYTLAYNGYFTDDAPLLDLAHGFTSVLADPGAGQTLGGARTLFAQHENETARLIAALFDAHDRGKAHPEAQVPQQATIFDDLAPIIARMVRVPGLTEDVLNSLEDPHARGLAPMMARQMVFNDRFPLDQNSQAALGSFATPVDRSRPDNDWNRSVMQRILHLVHDANGARFCNKDNATATVFGVKLGNYKQCQMFEIDDLGLFFILAMADHSITDDKSRPETRHAASFREQMTDGTLRGLIPDNGAGDFAIQQLAGINGFTRFPTPQAGARSLFLDQQHQSSFMLGATDPVTCIDGDRFIDVHADTIFAWEQTLPNNPSGFGSDTWYEAIRPLVNAFARHDECVAMDNRGGCTQKRNAAKILLDLMGALHEHWGDKQSTYFGKSYQSQSRAAPRFSTGDGVVTYERLTAEVLATSDLVPASIAIAPVLRTLTVDGTQNTPLARPYLVKTIQFLFDPQAAPPGLAYRDGNTQALRGDGKPAGQVTPYYLIADAFRRKRAALAAAPPAQEAAWSAATTTLVDQMLTVESVNGARRFQDRRMRGMTIALLDLLRGRIAAHDSAGDRTAWATKDLTVDTTRLLGSPVFAALSDLVARIEGSPKARGSLYQLLSYLVDQAQSDAAFQTALTALADDVQLFLDDPDMVPVAHALASAVDPERGSVQAGLRMLRRSRALDPSCPAQGGKRCTLTTLLANLYQEVPNESSPAASVADAIAEVDRATPGSNGAYTAADFKSILAQAHDFLTDEKRGFIRFVRIVKNRRYVSE